MREFDETVAYPSHNSSSSSGSSPHSDDKDENQGDSSQNVAMPKNKPDLSLKLKLITISKPLSTPGKRNITKARHTYSKPTHRQPSRAKKQTPSYLPDTDESSPESDNDKNDGDFIPEEISGKLIS